MNETNHRPRRKWLLLIPVAAVLLTLAFFRPLRNAWLDLTFYWTERTPTELMVKTFAEERGISIGEYPGSLIALLERNPETEHFVLNYPFRKDTQPEALPEPEGIPLFLQWDSRWGYQRYGSDFLAVTGCGPTCLSMAIYGLTGDETMTPDVIARFAEKEGYYEAGYGSSWTLISRGGPDLGLEVKELPLVKKKITDALDQGAPVILAMGPGDFTSSGHYILLTGMDESGFRVHDPNSRANSQKSWTYEQLEGQIRNIWRVSCS